MTEVSNLPRLESTVTVYLNLGETMSLIIPLLVSWLVLTCVATVHCDEEVTCDDWRDKLDTSASKLMVASYKETVPPQTLQEYNETFCHQQLSALSDATLVGEKCPSPSQRKFFSLYREGLSSHLSMACGDYDGMRDSFDAYKVFSLDNWNVLHSLFDKFILHVESIRDTVTDNTVKMPLACCAFNSYLSDFEKTFDGKLSDTLTLNDVLVDFVYDSRETMKTPFEAVCAGYYEADNYRCTPLTEQHPVNMSSSVKAASKSILIPLLDIVEQASLFPPRD